MKTCANCGRDISDHSEGNLHKCLVRLSERAMDLLQEVKEIRETVKMERIKIEALQKRIEEHNCNEKVFNL